VKKQHLKRRANLKDVLKGVMAIGCTISRNDIDRSDIDRSDTE
jgi:hypothetical protein